MHNFCGVAILFALFSEHEKGYSLSRKGLRLTRTFLMEMIGK